MLQIRNIEKRFGSQTALAGFNLDVRDGEFLSLLGPSGCGKTTLLNILAGFEKADQGELLWRGKNIENLPARERPFHMVFQGYALFPHLNVFENVAFALRLKALKDNEILTRVRESLELVGLLAFEKRSIETLSGGQQQRVAVARAIAPRPELVLLDEPLSALDRQLRSRMQTDLRILQKRLGLTFILVTHDQEEALSVSDRVALLHAGQLEQVGSPQDIYLEPRSATVASFVGARNTFAGKVIKHEGYKVCLSVGAASELWCVTQTSEASATPDATAFICPEHIRLRAPTSLTPNTLRGKVVETVFRGEGKEVFVETEAGISFRVRLEQEQSAALGDLVAVELPSLYTHVFFKGQP